MTHPAPSTPSMAHGRPQLGAGVGLLALLFTVAACSAESDDDATLRLTPNEATPASGAGGSAANVAPPRASGSSDDPDPGRTNTVPANSEPVGGPTLPSLGGTTNGGVRGPSGTSSADAGDADAGAIEDAAVADAGDADAGVADAGAIEDAGDGGI